MAHDEAQLSALALMDAYRRGSYEDANVILGNTAQLELMEGLVFVANGLLHIAAKGAQTSDEYMVKLLRAGLLTGLPS